jgi:hypothetical protein
MIFRLNQQPDERPGMPTIEVPLGSILPAAHKITNEIAKHGYSLAQPLLLNFLV